MTETPGQPPLPSFERPQSTPSLPVNSEAKEREARQVFNFKLKGIKEKQPEVWEKYYDWLLATRFLWSKKRLSIITTKDREQILECALRGEKPSWLLTPKEKKERRIKMADEPWMKRKDINDE